MPARMAGAAVFTEVVASMAAAFTPAHFAVDLADFMAAYGTVAQRASTMVSATATAATGTTAGEAGDTAGGGVTGWEGLTQHLAELVLLLRSRGLLPLRSPVQYGLADGSR